MEGRACAGTCSANGSSRPKVCQISVMLPVLNRTRVSRLEVVVDLEHKYGRMGMDTQV